MIIAIAGLPGSGSTTVAKLLSEKLNVPYFSAGQLFKDIAQGTWEKQHYAVLFKELCDKRKIVLPSFSSATQAQAPLVLWSTELGKNPAFHQSIEELQQCLAQEGNIILDGKLSIAMIKEATARVWLEGSIEVRSLRTAQRDKIAQAQARELLQRREKIHTSEWLRIYNIDYRKQAERADLVIDTALKSPEEIVQEIVHAIS